MKFLPVPLEQQTRTLIGGAKNSISAGQNLGAAALWKSRGTVLCYGTASVALVCLAYLVSPYWILCIPSLAGIELGRKGAARRYRTQLFERDYPTFLLSLASAIRTGSDPLLALYGCGTLFADGAPLREEVERLRNSIELGEREERAMQSFGVTIDHPDVELFRTAFILARRQGSSLAACLHRLAKVTRQRQSFRRRTRAAVAMQRFSAFGVAGSAILVTAIQSFGNPKALSEAWQHHIGAKLLVLGVLLLVAGLSWMLVLTRSRV